MDAPYPALRKEKSSLPNPAPATSLAIAGLVPLSTVDWPGHMAAVVFLQGCPWNCVYCHNPDLIDPHAPGTVEWQEVTELLERRHGLLDGLVFSGGEPTRQAALLDAARTVKNMGFKIGLHTGGSYPQRLAQLIPYLDWVGFDIKAAYPHYGAIVGTGVEDQVGIVGAACAQESLAMLVDAGIDVQARTTLHPGSIAIENLPSIVDMLHEAGVGSYRLQQARPEGAREVLDDGTPMVYDAPGWDQTFANLAHTFNYG